MMIVPTAINKLAVLKNLTAGDTVIVCLLKYFIITYGKKISAVSVTTLVAVVLSLYGVVATSVTEIFFPSPG